MSQTLGTLVHVVVNQLVRTEIKFPRSLDYRQSLFPFILSLIIRKSKIVVVVVVLLFYVHGKHLRSCRDGQLT